MDANAAQQQGSATAQSGEAGNGRVGLAELDVNRSRDEHGSDNWRVLRLQGVYGLGVAEDNTTAAQQIVVFPAEPEAAGERYDGIIRDLDFNGSDHDSGTHGVQGLPGETSGKSEEAKAIEMQEVALEQWMSLRDVAMRDSGVIHDGSLDRGSESLGVERVPVNPASDVDDGSCTAAHGEEHDLEQGSTTDTNTVSLQLTQMQNSHRNISLYGTTPSVTSPFVQNYQLQSELNYNEYVRQFNTRPGAIHGAEDDRRLPDDLYHAHLRDVYVHPAHPHARSPISDSKVSCRIGWWVFWIVAIALVVVPPAIVLAIFTHDQ